jgi:hypothetical protein
MRGTLLTILFSSAGCLITPGGTPAPRGCTDLYTEGGLAITVRAPTSAAAGRYRIEVDAGGDTLALDYELAADASAACVAPCTDEGAQFVIDQGLVAPGGVDMIAFITDPSRTKGPVTANVRVLRGAAVVYEQQVRPSYRTTEPNGRGCGQVSNADVTVTLP